MTAKAATAATNSNAVIAGGRDAVANVREAFIGPDKMVNTNIVGTMAKAAATLTLTGTLEATSAARDDPSVSNANAAALSSACGGPVASTAPVGPVEAAAIPPADVTDDECGSNCNIINTNNDNNNIPAGTTSSMEAVGAAATPSTDINIKNVTSNDVGSNADADANAAIDILERYNATADANAAVVGGLAHDHGIEATSNSDPKNTASTKAANAATAAEYPRDQLNVHVEKAIAAFKASTSWASFVTSVRGRGDLHPGVRELPHPAAHLLSRFQK